MLFPVRRPCASAAAMCLILFAPGLAAAQPSASAACPAVLGLLLTRQLGWDAGAQGSLLRAALTMNVAMAELQAQMAWQGEPPTGKQLEHIRAHPQGAVQALKQAGVTDPLWLDTVADHHERDDGQALATALIRAIGVHLPGTLVTLKSGEVGVVSRRPPGAASPLVATLTDVRGAPITTTHQRNSGLAEYAFVTALAEAPRLPKILPERVYGMMLL